MPRKKVFESKAEYDNYYNNHLNDRLNCIMERGTKDRIKIACDKSGIKSTNEFIKQAIEEKLYKCGVVKEVVKLADQEGQEPKN